MSMHIFDKLRRLHRNRTKEVVCTTHLADSPKTDHTMQRIKDQFDAQMDKHHLYLRPGINLDKIAAILHTNRTYVSRVVNHAYNTDFFTYVNDRRVEYAKQYMLEHPEVSQHNLAKICGYSSAPAFNKRFKDKEGITPKEWLSSQNA